MAVLGEAKDLLILEQLCAANTAFRFLPARVSGNTGPLAISSYRRIMESPAQAAFDLFEELYQVVPGAGIKGFLVTGSGGTAVANLIGIQSESEFKAISRMIAEFYPEIRAVFEIGGKTFKYIPMERGNNGRTSPVNDDSDGCEHGMGIFLEQQVARMRLSPDTIDASSADQAPRISSGCSVFIKSDMIHAQQKGYSPEEVLWALCETIVAKFKKSVVKSRQVAAPVAFVGAVSQHTGVVKALSKTFQLKAGELIVPDLYAWCGAIGAAMLAAESVGKKTDVSTFNGIRQLFRHQAEAPPDDIPPLSMEQVTLLCNRVAPYEAPPGNKPVRAYIGVDVGSVSTKIAVIDEAGVLVHDVYLPTAGMPVEAVREGLKEICRLWGKRLDVRAVGTTGSGRELVAEFIGADSVRDEITAHKTGAIHISQSLGGEPVDTIFEIGGQDSKYIFIENGVVTDFAMNEACAAGTGSFLEEQSEVLGIRIKEDFSKLALSAPAPARLGEFCTLATGNDLIARMQRGEAMPNLLAGLACAIARNFLNLVVRRRSLGKSIYFQGGTASNYAVAAALAGLLGRKITVPSHNKVLGAIGAALIAREWSQATGAKTKFRGYHLEDLHFTTRSFVCQGCNNCCDIKEFTIEGNKSHWGGKCSDRYSRPAVSDRKPVIQDLIAYREELFSDITSGGIEESEFRVALPRALNNFDLYPFWHRYLTSLGIKVVLSPVTDPKIIERGIETAAVPFCHPIKAAFGHVRTLTESDVDYILLPSIDATEVVTCSNAQCCLWTRIMPSVLKSAATLEQHKDKLLIPFISFREGPAQVKKALAVVMAKLDISRHDSDQAVESAYAAQKWFRKKLMTAGRSALQLLAETGEPGLLLVGRSYNIYDRNINCDVPRKLRTRYGANVIPYDFLATGPEPAGDLQDNLIWESSWKILNAAKLAASRDNLHLIYISNFLCGPDAATRKTARRLAGKPFLFLQFDGHGYDAGYMTRCEAYLDSKGILQCCTESTENKMRSAIC